MTITSLIHTTPKRLLLIAAATMLALAIAATAPALSRADVYCVHQAGFTCPAGTLDEGINLQTALNSAAGTPSTASSPNVITIGPGTYQPSPAGRGFSADIPYPLQVTGAGPSQTTLTDSGAPVVIKLVGASPNVVTLSGLTVGGSAGYGVTIVDGSVDHVAVDPSRDAPTSEVGVLLRASTVKDSTVTLPAGNRGFGLEIDGGSLSSNEIDDVTVHGGKFGVGSYAGAIIHRARLIGNTTSLAVDSAPIYIDDSLLVGGGIQAGNDPDGTEGSVQAVNDTIVSDGTSSVGLASLSASSSGSDITIYNSIVRGFPISFEAFGTNAALEAANDNYDGTTSLTAARSGATLNVSGTVTGDPAFVNPEGGDYHLAWNSPLIDAGDTGLVGDIASPTDLDGNPRDVAPLDLGAYEYQRRTPTAVATATPSNARVGGAITFDGGGSSDLDDGDTLTYAWSFDDGASASGATVTHAFTTPGAHTATLTVTDPTGLTSKQSDTVMVTAPATPPITTSSSGTTITPAAPHLVVLGMPSVKGNKLTLKLSCTGSAACSGIRVVETTNKTKLLASARLSLKAGQTKTVTLTLNSMGKRLLARLGKLPVVISVAINTTTVKGAHATLHSPKKPKHRHP